MMSSAELDCVRSAIQRTDSVGLAKSIEALALSEPIRWKQLWLLYGGVVDPSARAAEMQLKCFTGALRYLKENGTSDDIQHAVAELVLVYEGLNGLFVSAQEKLKGATFLREPLNHQILRMAAFLESQWQLGLRQQLDIAEDDQGRINSGTAMSSFMESNVGVKVGLGDVMEGHLDAIELVIRFSQYTGVAFSTDSRDVRTPYNDPSFKQTLLLSHYWDTWQYVWERIKYSGWRAKNWDGIVVVQPSDHHQYLLSECGRLREAQWQSEFAFNTAHMLKEFSFAAEESLARLLRSLELPPAGTPWNGILDVDAFRAVQEQGAAEPRILLWVEAKHYTETASKLLFSPGGLSTTWAEWVSVNVALRVLAECFDTLTREFSGNDDSGSLRLVTAVKVADLVRVVSLSTGVEPSRCEAALEQMTFDRKRKKLDIYAQPLLPLGEGLVLVSSTLVRIGEPARAVECALAEYGNDDPIVRGTGFEKVVASHFASLRGTKVEINASFTASDGKEVEFDVLVWWEQQLIIVETKFIRGIHSPASEWSARRAVVEAQQQLSRRRDIARSDWSEVRKSATSLDLPVMPPKIIHIIAVTTTTETTSTGGDIPVVDERCLAKFFSEPTIDAFEIGGEEGRRKVGTLERLWEGEEPTLQEFLTFLRYPAQLRMILSRMSLANLPIPIVEEGNCRMLLTTTELGPHDDILGGIAT